MSDINSDYLQATASALNIDIHPNIEIINHSELQERGIKCIKSIDWNVKNTLFTVPYL